VRVIVVPNAIPAIVDVAEVAATLPPSFCFSTKAQIKALLFCMSVFAVELRVIISGRTQSCSLRYIGTIIYCRKEI
jgi:hypothetical protein